jgi:hypothetical protein
VVAPQLLARVNDLDMGRAAYVVACQQRPDQYIVLALKVRRFAILLALIPPTLPERGPAKKTTKIVDM